MGFSGDFVAMAQDGYKPWWAIDKAAWREAFLPFYKFASITERDAPLPPWSDADVQEFINSDPVYGPQLKLVLCCVSGLPPSGHRLIMLVCLLMTRFCAKFWPNLVEWVSDRF